MMLEAAARVVVVGQVEVMDQVVVGLRGRTQVVKVVHRPEMAKRRHEKRRVAATGLGIVVS
jgi:hypothetical protein